MRWGRVKAAGMDVRKGRGDDDVRESMEGRQRDGGGGAETMDRRGFRADKKDEKQHTEKKVSGKDRWKRSGREWEGVGEERIIMERLWDVKWEGQGSDG